MNEQTVEDYNLKNVINQIRENPYKFICDYAESFYPHVGRKSFEVLALSPVSLIIPDISFGSKKIRSNIHTILLTASGGGKSSIAELFSKFTLNALKLESVTSAGLESSIMNLGNTFSLIVGDFARMSRDPTLMKVLEGMLGEEKSIKRKTARKDLDIEVNAVALLCGVSSDLSKYILSGMLWRLVPIMCGYSSEEHNNIGIHLMKKAGNVEEDNKEEAISEYYNELLEFQSSDKSIIGYKIPDRFKDELRVEWYKMTDPYVKELGLNFFRELMEGLRFLIAHAFLNVFNRKVENRMLIPNEEDFRIAMKLMKQSIKFKFRLIRSESFSKGLKDAKDFKKIMESDKIPEQVKEMIRGLVEVKGERVIKK